MGKFFRSIWTTVLGAGLAVAGTVTIADVGEAIKSGKILSVIAVVVGGAIAAAGRGVATPEQNAER